MGKIIGKVSGNNGSEQIVGNLNNNNSMQISSRVKGSNLGQITGNLSESNTISGSTTGTDFGTINGRVIGVIDAADLQRQIDALKERDVELFDFAKDIRLDLQAEINARLEQASSLLFYLNEEANKREAADANILVKLSEEIDYVLQVVANLQSELLTTIDHKVDKVPGKGLSTNDFTNELKEKLDNIEPEAEPNTIESISVNGITQAIIDKNVDIVISNIPTKTSDLINDGEGNGAFTTKNYVDEVVDLKQDILEFNPSEIPVTAITLTGIKNGDEIYVIPESGQTIDWSDVANKPHFKEVSVTANYNDLVNTPDIPENTSDLNNDSGFITDSALDGYATEDFVETYHDDTKQDTLIFNPEIPSGIETVSLSALKDGSTYYVLDNSKVDTRTGPIINFRFENSAEVTYSSLITTNCLLTIPNSISQGFISLLTISNMSANKTISIQKESESIPFNIRIVSNNTKYPGNIYTTAISGKKIIFARCDGVDVEILIIEELEG